MKDALKVTYLNRDAQLADIERELLAIEERLKTPERTVDDLICHIKLLKQRNSLLFS